jgi:hypothetical protein
MFRLSVPSSSISCDRISSWENWGAQVQMLGQLLKEVHIEYSGEVTFTIWRR